MIWKKLFHELKKRWKFIEIEKQKETDYFITYKYIIDPCRDDQAGLVELEKDRIILLSKGVDIKYDDMLIDGSISIIKVYSGTSNMFYDGYDLSVLLLVVYVLKNMFDDNLFIDNVAYVNDIYLESVKDIYPDIYKRIKENNDERKQIEKMKES